MLEGEKMTKIESIDLMGDNYSLSRILGDHVLIEVIKVNHTKKK